MDENNQKAQVILERVVLGFKWVLTFMLLLLAVVYLFKLTEYVWFKDGLQQAISYSPMLAVGLPISGVIALALVLALEQKAENIKFKAIGFEFEGAAGQIILWVITFLAMVLAIKTLV
ncbi:TPA: hypothetical protein ACPV0G_000754 [Vibrio parahaemolyticus]